LSEITRVLFAFGRPSTAEVGEGMNESDTSQRVANERAH